MTDVVQKRLELMTPEVEEMRRIKLYSEEEMRKLLIKRKEFEYKIHSRLKDLQDFTDYISYEKCLLKDIKLRRNKFKRNEKKSNIEYAIIKRIKSLYEIALLRFPDEITLFYSFLQFCDKVNFVNAASNVISNMIKKHSDNPQVWLTAAKWHKHQRKDTKSAMAMLLKAIAIHKDNVLLYREIVLTKLNEFDNYTSLKENVEQQDLCVKQLEKIINKTFENIKDCEFYLFVLEILEKYEFTNKVQDDIQKYLQVNCSDSASVWDCVAKKNMKDAFKDSKSLEQQTANEERSDESVINQLQACISKYKEGFAVISASHKADLWKLYIDYLLILQEKFVGNEEALEILRKSLNEAHEIGCLHENHLLTWLKNADQQEALVIAVRGTETIPHSIDLWTARLNLLIASNSSPNEIEEVFQLGIKSLKKNSLSLWKLIIKYYCQTSSDPSFIENMYMKGIVNQPKEISSQLKLQYIEWIFKTKGIQDARQIYKKVAVITPFSRDLHDEMLCLESTQGDKEACQQVYELACEQFGKTDIDVWINYINFYLNANKKNPNVNEIVESIRRRALQKLPQQLHDIFTERYYNIMQLV
ncbi:hypothetical protein ILUMI_23155 [Ignelater luminosus]|uniref:U3 small nucleolar RNA-associated protein 6 n=1 Tax=Ignelater luminosus TaxID=2038154 RepID=A0A8K0FZV8_IGNLU|nr:hypothetical protein ILUMI_23155 [Ignelater luminosus]